MLDEGGRDDCPGIVIEERGDEGQVGDERRCGRSSAGGVNLSPSGNVVEQGEGEKADETDSSSRGNVNSERHVGARLELQDATGRRDGES